MHDRDVIQSLFKSPNIGGFIYHMYNLYVSANGRADVKKVVNELTIKYPNHLIVGGAWTMNGVQINGYPPHGQLIKLMPDVWNDSTQQFEPATQVTDINLIAGQYPRNFN